MRPFLLLMVLMLALASVAAAQQTPSVDQIVKDAERAQAADQDRVRKMSEEAARAVQGAPSGAEAVGSAAPPAQGTAGLPLEPSRGLSLRHLLDRPVADRSGQPVGSVQDVLLGASGALVLVKGGDGQVRGINAARLLPGQGGKDGYQVDLDQAGITALPSFVRADDGWRMAE